MPKLKTHSGAAKRFSKTASGKFKRGQSKMRHILTSKATKTKRHLGGAALISKADTPKIARMIPYACVLGWEHPKFFKSSRSDSRAKGQSKRYGPWVLRSKPHRDLELHSA